LHGHNPGPIAANPSRPPLVRGGTERQTLARHDDGRHAIAPEGARIGWGERKRTPTQAVERSRRNVGVCKLTPSSAPGLDKCSGGKTARALHDQTPSSDLLPGWRLKDRAGKFAAHGPSCSGRPPHPAEGRLHRPPMILAAPATGRSPDSRAESRIFRFPMHRLPGTSARAVSDATWRPSDRRLPRGSASVASTLAHRCGGSRGLAAWPRTPFPFHPPAMLDGRLLLHT
jgi:hypothetical protein